ncbi:hypothetical protein EGW08_000961 [Elysia chlorotica]|uniref:Uncharacterized protein n=1 Tax=Elysia chlorotica TaxID=188477 RepID=A0A433UBQ0_ELYCH|nr:hypothetical protein EGW08_000961 [Elysia chlorotica]
MGGALSCLTREVTPRWRRPAHLDYSVTIRLSEEGDTPDHVNFYSNSALGGTSSAASTDSGIAKLHEESECGRSGNSESENHLMQESQISEPSEPFPRDSVPLLGNQLQGIDTQCLPTEHISVEDGIVPPMDVYAEGKVNVLPHKDKEDHKKQPIVDSGKKIMLNGCKSKFSKRLDKKRKGLNSCQSGHISSIKLAQQDSNTVATFLAISDVGNIIREGVACPRFGQGS